MKSSLDSEETGPNRNSADFRIKKAQVRFYFTIFNLCPIYWHVASASYSDERYEMSYVSLCQLLITEYGTHTAALVFKLLRFIFRVCLTHISHI